MERNNCRDGTDRARIASDVRGASEAKQPAGIQRTQAASRYLYMAGALAAVVLLIMLAAV
jgi:hypothetical protein